MRITAGVGSPAPGLELPTASGHPRSLEDYRGRPVLLSFLGPATCSICRAHVIKMIQARPKIAEVGADVVLVAFDDPELLTAKMLRALDLPYALLLDRTKESYVRWGLQRVSVRSFLVPSLYWALAKQAVRPGSYMGKAPDEGQLGGDFVIDAGGILRFANRMRSLHDRATPAQMLAAVPRGGVSAQ
jgi:peroxiredoxin